MRLPRGPIRRRKGQAEAGLPVLPGPGEPPAVLRRHLLGEGQAEADPFGLARDERLAQGVGQLGRRPGPGVGDLDGDLLRSERLRGSPCRRVPRPRWRSGRGSAPRHGRPTGRRGVPAARSPPMAERDLGVLARRVDQEGDVREEPAQVADLGGRRSTRPSERSPLTCSSVIASCRRATSRLRSSCGGGKRLACSWTLIRAPVSEFRSWWARPAASWARSRVRSDCWMVRLISLSWTHIALTDRARSGTSSRPRPGSNSSKSPPAMRATCRLTSRMRRLMRWAIQLVTAAMRTSEPPPSSKGGVAASRRACRQLVSG